MSNTAAILGHRYSERDTGMVGTAISRTQYLHNCVRVTLQPKAKEGDTTPPPTFFCEEQVLSDAEGLEDATQAFRPEPPIHALIGKKVRDAITGFEGTVILATEYEFSATRLAVQAKGLYRGNPIEPHMFDEQQLVVLEQPIAWTSEPELPQGKAVQASRPGGPGRDVPRLPGPPLR